MVDRDLLGLYERPLRIFWGREKVSRVGIACKHVLPNISADPHLTSLYRRLTHATQVFRTQERTSWVPTLSLWVRALGAQHVFPYESESGENRASPGLVSGCSRACLSPTVFFSSDDGSLLGFLLGSSRAGALSALQSRWAP